MNETQAKQAAMIVYGMEPTNAVEFEAAKACLREAINAGYRFNILTGEVIRTPAMSES